MLIDTSFLHEMEVSTNKFRLFFSSDFRRRFYVLRSAVLLEGVGPWADLEALFFGEIHSAVWGKQCSTWSDIYSIYLRPLSLMQKWNFQIFKLLTFMTLLPYEASCLTFFAHVKNQALINKWPPLQAIPQIQAYRKSDGFIEGPMHSPTAFFNGKWKKSQWRTRNCKKTA